MSIHKPSDHETYASGQIDHLLSVCCTFTFVLVSRGTICKDFLSHYISDMLFDFLIGL
jgi:hypothetical protein